MPFRTRFFIAASVFFAVFSLGLSASALADNPVMTVEPTAGLAFGTQEVGAFGPPRNIGIRSAGDGNLKVTSVRIEGTDPGDFYIESATPCQANLLPTSSCSVPVQFTPVSAGEKSAIIVIESNSLGGTVSLPLTGTATPSTLAPPTPAAPRVTFVKKPKNRISIKAKKLGRLSITFRSNGAGHKFQCRLGTKPFSGCRSPLVLRGLKPGRHQLRVRAVAADGRVGPAAVSRFQVVRRR